MWYNIVIVWFVLRFPYGIQIWLSALICTDLKRPYVDIIFPMMFSCLYDRTYLTPHIQRGLFLRHMRGILGSVVTSHQLVESRVKSSQQWSSHKSSQVIFWFTQVKSNQVKHIVKSQHKSQVRSSQVKSNQVKSSQVKSSQVKSSQVNNLESIILFKSTRVNNVTSSQFRGITILTLDTFHLFYEITDHAIHVIVA